MLATQAVPAVRSYRVRIRLPHLDGTLPAGTHHALVTALRLATNGELSRTVAAGDYDSLVTSATIRSSNTVDALVHLNRALDRALVTAGIFVEFDVSGKTMRASPTQSTTDVHGE